jgi:arsenite-transporting ATPase
VLFEDDPMSIAKDGDSFVLSMSLPFTERDELELSVKGDEMFVRVGPYRRTLILPKSLSTRVVASAALRHERLEVVFEKRQT